MKRYNFPGALLAFGVGFVLIIVLITVNVINPITIYANVIVAGIQTLLQAPNPFGGPLAAAVLAALLASPFLLTGRRR